MPTVPSSRLLCQIRKQSIWSWVGVCACRVLLVVEAWGGSLLMDAASALWWPGQGPTLLIFTSNCHRLHFGRIITTASCIKHMRRFEDVPFFLCLAFCRHLLARRVADRALFRGASSRSTAEDCSAQKWIVQEKDGNLSRFVTQKCNGCTTSFSSCFWCCCN